MTPQNLPRLAQTVHSSPSTLLLILGTFVMVTILLTSDQRFFVQDVEASPAEVNDQLACENGAKDMMVVPSQYGVTETVARLQVEIQARGLGVFSVIDHSSAMPVEGETLRPTTLVLFGGPALDAPLLQSEQSIGIDLPLKYLVWQDACDQIYIGYTEVAALQKRHKIREQDEAFQFIADLLNEIALSSAVSLE
ncbi:MAG: DUF302 domain-containing protein [Caldilineaceae bacterium]